MHSTGDRDSSPANSDDEWLEVNSNPISGASSPAKSDDEWVEVKSNPISGDSSLAKSDDEWVEVNSNPISGQLPAGDWIVLEDGLIPKEEVIFLGDEKEAVDDDTESDDNEKEAVDDETESDDNEKEAVDETDEIYVDKTPKLSGVFYHTVKGLLGYAPFGPDLQPLPDPALTFLPEPVTAKSSAGGLLCCRGQWTRSYYVCNPLSFAWTAIPDPANHHGDDVSIVLILGDDDTSDYHIVCAFRTTDPREINVHYGFESFSSQCWAWFPSSAPWISEEGVIAEESGVAANGAAHWRTSMQTVLSYIPAADTFQETVCPEGFGGWELGEIGGRLCCTGLTETMAEVMVMEDGGMWREMKWMDVGPSRLVMVEDNWPVPLRSLGGTDMLFWVAKPWTSEWQVIAQNVETETMRWLTKDGGPQRYGGGALIPYLSSLAGVVKRESDEEPADKTQDLEALATLQLS